MTEPNAEAFPEPPPPRPSPVVVAPKPFGAEYGFVDGQRPYESTREELVARLAEGRPTPFVWTPETEGIVPPWTVPYLFDAYRDHGVRHSRKVAATWGAIGAVLLLYAGAVQGNFNFLNGFVLGGFLALVVGFYSFLEWQRFRRLTPDKLTLKVREQATRPPPRRGPARYTQAVAGAIGGVMVLQALTALVLLGKPPPIMFGASAMVPSIEAAGMLREAVQHGQWWRLISAAYLHDGLLHFGMNLMALLALGRMIEAFGHRAYVPILFFLTALAASTASYASGAEASVGASGGILGLFGFLAVMARRRRDLMPAGFGRAIVTDIAVIAAIGIFGYGHVDNWAHAGGFVSGAFLGWLMIPRGGRTPYWEPSPAIRTLGNVALALTMLSGLGTVLVLALTLFVRH